MKLKCVKDDLLFALNIITKGVGGNNTLPVLDNVFIKAEGKKIFFLTTDLDISISYSIDANIENEGSTTIPAKKIYEYISFLTDDEVSLEKIEGETLFLKSKSSRTKIKGISSEEFPQMPIFEEENILEVDSIDFVDAIGNVVFACSNNSIRPVLSGVLFNIFKDKVKLVGTDSYRLSEKEISILNNSNLEKNIIIPAKTCSEIVKIVNKSKDKLKISIAKNQIQFVFGETKLISRLIDGTYPDYEKIIPVKPSVDIDFSVDEMIMALRRLNVFAKENNFFIKIETKKSDNKLILTTNPSENGEQETEVNVKITGDDNKIALNSKYLLDILGVLRQDTGRLQISDSSLPIIVLEKDEKSYRNIIMPLKIN